MRLHFVGGCEGPAHKRSRRLERHRSGAWPAALAQHATQVAQVTEMASARSNNVPGLPSAACTLVPGVPSAFVCAEARCHGKCCRWNVKLLFHFVCCSPGSAGRGLRSGAFRPSTRATSVTSCLSCLMWSALSIHRNSSNLFQHMQPLLRSSVGPLAT